MTTDDSLTLTMGPVDGFNPSAPRCNQCGSDNIDETAFSVTVDGQPGKVCFRCLQAAGEDSYPAALGLLAQGLNDVCEALDSQPPETRADLYRMACEALEWLDD